MFSYDIALIFSLVLSGIGATFLFFLILFPNCLAISSPPVLGIYLIVSSIFAMSIFVMTFSSMNVALQLVSFMQIDHIRYEFNNGIIFLRFTALVIGYKSLSAVKHLALVLLAGVNSKLDKESTKKLLKTSRIFSHFLFKNKHEYHELKQLNYTKTKTQHEWEYLIQFGIYLYTIICIGLCLTIDNNNLYLLFLISALFFVADDWIIIHDYAKETKGRILKMHNMRIDVLNIIIYSLLIPTLINIFPLVKSIPLVFILLILGILRYLNFFQKIENNLEST